MAMKKHKTTTNQFDEAQAVKSKEFQEDTKLDSDEMRMVDDMATITAVMHRLLFMINTAPNEIRKAFAQKLFKLKEEVDERFPLIIPDGSSINAVCPLCLMEDDKSGCTHQQHVRAGIMLLATFRYHPKIDLDEKEDEIPDTNEGMVTS